MKRISDDRIAFYESQTEKQPTAVGSGESFNSFKEKFLSQGISVISERGVFESREYLRKFGQYIARTFAEFYLAIGLFVRVIAAQPQHI